MMEAHNRSLFRRAYFGVMTWLTKSNDYSVEEQEMQEYYRRISLFNDGFIQLLLMVFQTLGITRASLYFLAPLLLQCVLFMFYAYRVIRYCKTRKDIRNILRYGITLHSRFGHFMVYVDTLAIVGS
jgi:hypothetical protein